MNRALPEMLQYFFNNAAGNCADMTVLERQRARIKCQQEQQLQQLQNQQNGNSFFNGSEFGSLFSLPSFQGLMGEVITGPVKPSSENGWPELGKFELPGVGLGVGSNSETVNANGFEPNSAISRTSSCPPAVVVMVPEVAAKGTESVPSEKLSSAVGRESFKKRKADKMQNTKVVSEDDSEEKKIKVCTEEGESKITDRNSIKNNREASGETSKENSKASEVQKPDYIHVRARRGQATDSHSLAERVRREKISERMKYLQDLVPGCNKITGKAGMLDEIINYVQSLQRQVEFLSMKLAAVNPRLDFNVEDLFSKEAFPACTTNFPAVGISPEMTNSSNYIQFNPSAQQMVSICGMEMGLNPSSDLGLRRSISAQVSIPETFLDSTFFTQFQPTSAWDSDVQNLVNSVCDPRRSATAFSTSQPFTGSIEASNLKTEM